MSEQLYFVKKDSVRVRIAPSPTGPLHLGTARTALFNYLFAKKNQGAFILRIEDTDLKRSDPNWEKDILENLKWLGINWDEGPDIEGNYGPYRQSQRKKIYEKYIKKLFEDGFLYWCFCTEEELRIRKEEQIARGEPPLYDGRCRHLSEKEIKEFQKERRGILRFKMPQKIVHFRDLIRKEIEFDTSLLGDIAVARDFFTPFYNLAVVIDDYEMEINYVMRGEDHLSNTPKQILLQEALSFPRPKYIHLPLILGLDKAKLSKRNAVVKISDYKERGYFPEAMINFLVFLGWNPGTEEEIFSLGELIEKFSIERIQKGGAIFNLERLNWLNGYYIRKTPLLELTNRCLHYLTERGLIEPLKEEEAPGISEYKISSTGKVISFNYFERVISLFQERLKFLSEIFELADFFFKDEIIYDKKLLIWKDTEEKETKRILKQCYKLLKEIKEENWQEEVLKEIIFKEAEKESDRGKVLWPLRVALTGKDTSPPFFDIAMILGKKITLKRIKEAIKKLND